MGKFQLKGVKWDRVSVAEGETVNKPLKKCTIKGERNIKVHSGHHCSFFFFFPPRRSTMIILIRMGSTIKGPAVHKIYNPHPAINKRPKTVYEIQNPAMHKIETKDAQTTIRRTMIDQLLNPHVRERVDNHERQKGPKFIEAQNLALSHNVHNFALKD